VIKNSRVECLENMLSKTSWNLLRLKPQKHELVEICKQNNFS